MILQLAPDTPLVIRALAGLNAPVELCALASNPSQDDAARQNAHAGVKTLRRKLR